MCQLFDQLGHTTKSCPQLPHNKPTINYTTTATGKKKMWLMGSTASHNITSDIRNLSIHSKYDNINDVILGDGLSLQLSHIGP